MWKDSLDILVGTKQFSKWKLAKRGIFGQNYKKVANLLCVKGTTSNILMHDCICHCVPVHVEWSVDRFINGLEFVSRSNTKRGRFSICCS